MSQRLRPDDPRLTWEGVLSLQREKGWVLPWRLPYEERVLFYPDMLLERAMMAAGVRISFHSDTTLVKGELAETFVGEARLDLCCDGALIASMDMEGRDSFTFTDLPGGDKLIELWLPQVGIFRLRALELDDGATVVPFTDSRPRWITYGSSITQCAGAASPTQTWPAIVARRLGLNLTCLGFGGQCHLDTMVALAMRDRPADVISMAVGINIYGGASLGPRSFRPAIIGFVRILREKHPDIPIVVRSPIFSPPREETPNAVGFTLRQMRQEVEAAVTTLQEFGDCNVHYVDGLQVLGPDAAHLLPDDLHPNAEGYRLMGHNFTRILGAILGRQMD